MLVFSDLSLRRGVKPLLESASVSIHPSQRVGVTGANGVGKSSLFALIRGELSPDTGHFSLPPSWVIAHVKQETPSSDQTALDYALEGDAEYVSLRTQLQHADGAHLGELHARLDAINGYTAESRAATLLHGLGFKPEEIQRPVKSFSGGWRVRLNLARALMSRSRAGPRTRAPPSASPVQPSRSCPNRHDAHSRSRARAAAPPPAW